VPPLAVIVWKYAMPTAPAGSVGGDSVIDGQPGSGRAAPPMVLPPLSVTAPSAVVSARHCSDAPTPSVTPALRDHGAGEA
jgi:hypothetical protein